ncbi:ATP-binding protein [Agriterribacter sp.]|uniref:ATP-binding protein n=1 Tax=Agriterribacter sp. TaxID=2821509 RepID=UPI002C10300A|nr:ATP-binding protein [Agriterribacter sp.]HRP58296.1 HTH domain-containing protein [Agriterribacter sp.]
MSRHLPDKFYLKGDQRISLRTTIFREIAANLIIHREYTNAAPATFIIYADRVETENANNPHGEGPIDPTNFVPFPKNPLIAKFFIQLGRVEELGSGILTTTRLMKEYVGKGKAFFIEGATFKTIVSLPDGKAVVINDTVNDTVKQRMKRVIQELIKQPGLKSKDLAKLAGVSEVSIRRDMQKLMQLVEFRGAPKTGGYFLTDHMLLKLDKSR